jgi:hypothetical protein
VNTPGYYGYPGLKIFAPPCYASKIFSGGVGQCVGQYDLSRIATQYWQEGLPTQTGAMEGRNPKETGGEAIENDLGSYRFNSG